MPGAAVDVPGTHATSCLPQAPPLPARKPAQKSPLQGGLVSQFLRERRDGGWRPGEWIPLPQARVQPIAWTGHQGHAPVPATRPERRSDALPLPLAAAPPAILQEQSRAGRSARGPATHDSEERGNCPGAPPAVRRSLPGQRTPARIGQTEPAQAPIERTEATAAPGRCLPSTATLVLQPMTLLPSTADTRQGNG